MSKSGDWYIRENPDGIEDDGYDEYLIMMDEKRFDAEEYVKDSFISIASRATTIGQVAFEDILDIAQHDLDFHAAIWYASTEILPNLEVQVVIDSNNKCHVSTGSSGYVDFTINPVGMKLPIRCWIHTHPFGAAYFSGTDIRTVSIWKPLMECAYVLGGEGHYGFWEQRRPEELDVYIKGSLDYTQRWGDMGEEE
jgi:hypothetical protein